ncbi:hypothetical protein BIWAKO_01913 [Bosea sp. BIWAKO-01]|nr:hypothetical protein BIWAKO_01913 [Bosea sp. BIWAKO-01]
MPFNPATAGNASMVARLLHRFGRRIQYAGGMSAPRSERVGA